MATSIGKKFHDFSLNLAAKKLIIIFLPDLSGSLGTLKLLQD